jgi:hypothetical protein
VGGIADRIGIDSVEFFVFDQTVGVVRVPKIFEETVEFFEALVRPVQLAVEAD